LAALASTLLRSARRAAGPTPTSSMLSDDVHVAIADGVHVAIASARLPSRLGRLRRVHMPIKCCSTSPTRLRLRQTGCAMATTMQPASSQCCPGRRRAPANDNNLMIANGQEEERTRLMATTRPPGQLNLPPASMPSIRFSQPQSSSTCMPSTVSKNLLTVIHYKIRESFFTSQSTCSLELSE